MLVDLSRWSSFILNHPESHILQNGKWGELKASFGWRAEYLINGDAGVQILFRKIPFGYSIAYIPKGPIGFNDKLINEIDALCRSKRAIFLKLEPFDWEPNKEWEILSKNGYIPSKPIQPRRTVIIPLEKDEEEILAGMKQKTRYNIRLAEKKGVVIQESEDYEVFHKMALATGERDKFGIHSLAYYQKIKEFFNPNHQSKLLIALYNNEPIAGIIVFAQGKNAWYMYGASLDSERNRMPTYLLQWEGIKWARRQGCLSYDLWGIPDYDEEELERFFAAKELHEGLWGVYRFKRGFGGSISRSVGAWDKVYISGMYQLYKMYTHLLNGGME